MDQEVALQQGRGGKVRSLLYKLDVQEQTRKFGGQVRTRCVTVIEIMVAMVVLTIATFIALGLGYHPGRHAQTEHAQSKLHALPGLLLEDCIGGICSRQLKPNLPYKISIISVSE